MPTQDTKPVRTVKTAAEATDKAATANVNAAERTAGAARTVAKDMTDAAFAYPTTEVPEMMRSFAEQGLNQSREAYSRMKGAAEDATGMLEESFNANRENMRTVQYKTLDAAQANTEAAFDLFRKMLSVNSFADAVQVQTSFARERFEAFMDYSKDMQSTLTKVGAEAAKPAKAIMDRTMNQAKAA